MDIVSVLYQVYMAGEHDKLMNKVMAQEEEERDRVGEDTLLLRNARDV